MVVIGGNGPEGSNGGGGGSVRGGLEGRVRDGEIYGDGEGNQRHGL